MAGELWLSPFGSGLAANIPANYPADTSFAFYLATDTGQLYIAQKPTSGTTATWIGKGGGTPVAVTDAATYTVLAANSGRTHRIPDLTADITITLPAPFAGADYLFEYGGAAADAQGWLIQAAASAAFTKGGVVHLDSDAAAAGDEVVPVYANGSSHYKLTVTTPEAGTSVHVTSDGTYWYINGTVVSATAPAFS